MGNYDYPTLDDIDKFWHEALTEVSQHVEPVEKRGREDLPSLTYDRHR